MQLYIQENKFYMYIAKKMYETIVKKDHEIYSYLAFTSMPESWEQG